MEQKQGIKTLSSNVSELFRVVSELEKKVNEKLQNVGDLESKLDLKLAQFELKLKDMEHQLDSLINN
jgi:uncharacterized coiled-coil protein SlyX